MSGQIVSRAIATSPAAGCFLSRSVRQYPDRIRHYQIFNEPVYTHYSLPKRLGYDVKDYIRWMNLAADTIRSEQEDAVIIGGMES